VKEKRKIGNKKDGKNASGTGAPVVKKKPGDIYLALRQRARL
jgi:hypothetical protein